MPRPARATAPRLSRAQPLSLLDPPAPAPAPAPSPVPPAWAVEASSKGSQPRDFTALRELVWHRDQQRFVVRERQDPRDGGAHIYRAFERADVGFYGVMAEDLGPAVARPFGRIDTLKPPRAFDPIGEYSDAMGWLLKQQSRAVELIKELCPETIHARGDAVFDGPGHITMLTRPEPRYLAVMATRRPA